MYDLTGLLTTVAACSATVVAIIGGFIASKLISIGTERTEIINKLSEIDKEISFRKNEADDLQSDIDEDDSQDFIVEHIDDIIEENGLDAVYKFEDQPPIDKDALRPYWEIAQTVYKRTREFFDKQDDMAECQMNKDDIPVLLAKQMGTDFEYDICKEILDNNSKKNNILGALSISALSAPRLPGMWYHKAKEKVSDNKSAIKWLEIQQQNLNVKKAALQKPVGMMGGIIIFILFAIANIILPLVLTPFCTNDHRVFCLVKFGVISLFAIGLCMVVGYLIYLLKREPK